jgi:hypothetical protein
MNNPLVHKTLVVVIWLVALYLGISKGSWLLAIAIAVLHTIEVFIKGISVGTRAGKSKLYSVIMTLVFGYAWWKFII